MQHKPNLIKLAVSAARGRMVVSQALGVSPWAVTWWARSGHVPTEHVRPLCALGNNAIGVDQLLAYIEERARQAAEEKKAA